MSSAKPRSMYDARWRRRRAMQLGKFPACAMCMSMHGRLEPATVADHIVPHRGDAVLFQGPLQSLCQHCHSSLKQQQETAGYLRGHDRTGRPLDANHHWNRDADDGGASQDAPDPAGQISAYPPSRYRCRFTKD